MSVDFTVPVVDIGPYVRDDGSPADRARVAAEMDAACRTVGFVQILGHGVPTQVTDGLAGAMDDFFGQDLEVKKTYRTPPHINRGYAPPKSESLSLSLGVEAATRMNDFFEAFNVGAARSDYPAGVTPEDSADDYAENLWPAATAGFDGEAYRAAVQAYFVEARRVARTLTRVFADALDVPADFFATRTDHSLDVLRMNNYALPPGLVDLDGELTGMGEHTDYGIVTVLWADRVAGLQVLDTDGDWHDVSPIEGGLLVNLGDLTARWTNERWMSTLHRVKPPVVDGTIRRRRSAAFFHDGNIDAVISTIGSCIGQDGAHYPDITVGEHIRAKLRGSRAGERNTAAEREAARVLSAKS
ncbi:isopenicillin N synthase family oxygenase [Nakamurella flavida]|uniref:Isopenicillin N synthase family oxygenase n=1 Tax=Nakamurella flavida TaxID=363630 RepID=A0A939C5W8_9ACTN|nr:isopenicillin N synthase family oxygenase [Nakamurella flavida]MBM9476612.1 isopenicillin N synthase family oxygenase [Nakamurella flavida]MDP9778950.1 isopenicillin N synthase-like dioxygenase [Nakamurella flavida]